ncbi:MAG TPA: cellulase family glycosylhydrolase [Planctomycetota bacterium]|nr:cellulase family glycosylhydrolase [Planctomycetota bacterium]
MSRRLARLLILLAGCSAAPEPRPRAERIAVAPGGRGFVRHPSGQAWVPWGVNYDRDASLHLLEEYWDFEWNRVAGDFREIQALGCTVVRVHLQFGRFMKSPELANEESLARLARLLDLAEGLGLYLDLTGLGCYRKEDAPLWYLNAPEKDRWAMQARFWESVAKTCAPSPAVFCYTLMNEPLSAPQASDDLLGGDLGGLHYVERLTRDPAGRTRSQVTRQWMETLIPGIRRQDPSRLVSCGMFFLFEVPNGLTLGPDPAEAGAPLDFLSLHLYPRELEIQKEIDLLRTLTSAGKPIVIQEMYTLHCSLSTFRGFLEKTRGLASGWMGFYWGRTIAECKKSHKLEDALMAAWLEFFKEQGPRFRAP